MLNVGMVACCLNTAHIRGMGKYVMELLRNSSDDIQWRLFANDPALPVKHPPGDRFVPDIFEFRGDRFRLWEQLGLPRRSRRADVSLLHCTEGVLPLWQPRPTIVTLHDTLAFEERSDTAVERFYWDRLMPAALHRAAHVITISESSRKDILTRWPGLESKLTVIYHGIDAEYFEPPKASIPAALKAALGDARFLVYLGGPLKRKRFDWALEVLAAVPDTGLKLVACGFGSAGRQAAAAELPPALRGRVLFAEFLSDAELHALYTDAAAVLYPTLYEGFGFPAIEAQAAGTPVVFSPLGSLAELVGPLATLVDARDLSGWVAAVKHAIEMTSEERRQRATQARAWAHGFRWDESWRQHLSIYQRVART